MELNGPDIGVQAIILIGNCAIGARDEAIAFADGDLDVGRVTHLWNELVNVYGGWSVPLLIMQLDISSQAGQKLFVHDFSPLFGAYDPWMSRLSASVRKAMCLSLVFRC